MFLIGLTGGIAAGKTTVAKRLVELGAFEIDADILSRKAVERGSDGLRQVVATFGASVLNDSGDLNRQALAEIIFSDPEKRELLESIVHPIVRRLAQNALGEQAADSIVVYSVPLLVEATVDLPFDIVVSVEAPQSAQIERMMKTRNMTRQQAEQRIGAQASPAQRANRADIILNSNQSLGRMIDDVDALWQDILRRAAKKQGE